MSPSANPTPNRVTTRGTWATRDCLYQKGGCHTKTHSRRPDNGALLQVLCHCLRIGSLFAIDRDRFFHRLLASWWEYGNFNPKTCGVLVSAPPPMSVLYSMESSHRTG